MAAGKTYSKIEENSDEHSSTLESVFYSGNVVTRKRLTNLKELLGIADPALAQEKWPLKIPSCSCLWERKKCASILFSLSRR